MTPLALNSLFPYFIAETPKASVRAEVVNTFFHFVSGKEDNLNFFKGKVGVGFSHLTFLVEGSHFSHFVGGKPECFH